MKTFIKALPVFLIFFSIGRFIKYDFTFDSIVIATATIGVLGTVFLFLVKEKIQKQNKQMNTPIKISQFFKLLFPLSLCILL